MRPDRLLRALQSHAPFLRPAKFSAYNMATRWLGWHIEPEFRLLSHFRPINVAVDVGANWGQSIYALMRTCRPSAIVSFEPNRQLADRLKQVFRREGKVRIEACGLGEQEGHFTLIVPRYRNFIYDGLASLDEQVALSWLNPDRVAFFDPTKLVSDRFRVEVRTLDSYELTPDVVKIDVQGRELEVVKGGEATFRRALPITIIESPSLELVDLFGDMGMLPFGYDGTHLIPNDMGRTNTVFIHPDRLAGSKLVRQ